MFATLTAVLTRLYDLDPGPESPELVRAIIEIPKGSANKIEYDGDLGPSGWTAPLLSDALSRRLRLHPRHFGRGQ